MQEYFHSVTLNRDKCTGCTNCIKRCPTEAIRVRDGKARIIKERCIDCGECIRVCPHHAKTAVTDPLEAKNAYRYSIAMPAPSPTPKKQKKPLRFPARRWAQLAACAAVCGVCLYGAVYAYEWKGVTLLGGGSSSNYSAAATKAAAPQAAVYSMEDTENATYGSADNGISSFSAEDGYRSADTATGGSPLTSGEAESDASTRTADSAKIIYTANLTLETRDYNTARAALDAALSDADGYMESSSEYTNTDSTRSVSLTLRVPQDSYKSFLAAAAQSGSVTYQNQQAEDITTRYMDTEARLASLTAQRTRLQELQAQADTLADLLEIESSLSDVQYQIESWQSQLDWYSNQVSCCTVYITLNEVETLTPTSTSFGAKLLAALRNGWTGFVSGAQAVAVFLVGAWPAILIGAVCGVIYYRVRHPRKKK